MCSQKNCKALASPPSGELSARRVPGEPGACLPCGAHSGFHLSVPEHPGAEDCPSATDSGDCPSPHPLWVPEDPGAAEALWLEHMKEAVVSPVSRRRPGTAL